MKTRIDTLTNGEYDEFIEVSASDDSTADAPEVEIRVSFGETEDGDEDPGETYLYATAGQADEIAVALIQATDLTHRERNILGAIQSALRAGGITDVTAGGMIEIGLAFIRAKKP